MSKPKFDPNAPFDVVDGENSAKPKFDPNAAFEVVDNEPEGPNVSTLESAIRGGVQGIPFVGSYADEAEGLVRSVAKGIPYTEGRQQARDANKAADVANPLAYGGAQVAAALPINTAKLVPGLGQAIGAVEGGIYGLGASEADLTQGDILGAASDAGTGAAIGAALPFAFRGAGKAIGKLGDISSEALNKVAPGLAARLKDFAEIQSARAMGLERGTRGKLTKQQVSNIGRFGLDAVDPVTGKNIVSGFANTDDMVNRTFNINKESGEAIGEIADQIDRSGFRGFSPSQTADLVESQHGNFYRDPLNKSETHLLDNALESIKMRGDSDIGIAEAQKLKKTLGKAANWENKVVVSEKERLAREIYKTVNDKVEEATEKGAKYLQNPELFKEFMDSKKLYGSSVDAAKLLKNKTSREQGNKLVSLTDSIVGSAGLAGDLGTTAVVLGSKKLGERYGAQNMARGADALAKKVMSIPKLSSKYGKVLQDAAARGETSLAATHYILQQQDPEYREQMLEKGYDPNSNDSN